MFVYGTVAFIIDNNTDTPIADTHHGLQHNVQIMAAAEPLTKEGSPPSSQSSKVKLEMEDKIV